MNQKTESLPASLSGTVALGGEVKVHRLGFGAMRITGEGIWGPPKDPASALKVLRCAVELGVNFIDTADSYGADTSEQLIAEALSPYPEDLVIATWGYSSVVKRSAQVLRAQTRVKLNAFLCRRFAADRRDSGRPGPPLRCHPADNHPSRLPAVPVYDGAIAQS
jgi:hypothetical protein